jgi:hypothetical protein
MASPSVAEPLGPTAAPAASAPREPSGPGPVAVVWCRQVDNEAESPGYTTVPEEFPGRRETLELIRLVGNLTVNVADTHDYWTPGPPAPLSYYPNLFLYPAYGGRYTCVGRMFLSTEDRPRLGMKTLVLDTQQLLASGEFGNSVLRWYSTMAGSRADGRRPPVPDPALFALLGEGLLFYRGSTEPVVVAASNEWDAAMEVIFELVRVLPASLLQLGAILAFPYFLPQPKTNLHEFAEQVPLALALMRIPMAEAMGDRHKRRIQSWESTSVNFRDLTDGVRPPATGRSKEVVPLVVQLVRDHNAQRLQPIVQRVDLVELPKLRGVLSDPERQSGKERRKEMWRIGTAMESAALLLSRSRGRHVPVSVETARRAQEYLKAQIPVNPADAPPEPAVVTGTSDPALASSAGGHPSWLAKGADLATPPRPGPPEVVPVSVSEDPSLLPAAKGAAGGAPAAPGAPARAAPVPPATVNPREMDGAVARALEPRLHAVEDEILRRLALEVEQAVGGEVDRKLEAAAETKFKILLQASEARLAQSLTLFDARQQEKIQGLTEALARLPGPTAQSALEASLQTKIAEATALFQKNLAEVAKAFQTRLAESETRSAQQWTGLLASTEGRLRETLPGTLGAEIDRRLRSAIERELEDAPQGPRGLLAERIDERTDATVRRELEGSRTQFERSLAELEARWDERLKSFQPAQSALSARALESVLPVIDRKLSELADVERRALEELRSQLISREDAERAALAVTFEQELREAIGRSESERAAAVAALSGTVASRLAEADERRPRELKELETRLTALVETRTKESHARLTGLAKELEVRTKLVGDDRLTQIEGRLAGSVDRRLDELREAQAHNDADLQVRLQSYTDQKQREAEERLRATTVELMARVRSEFESSLGKVPELSRIDTLVKERLARTGDALRSELALAVNQRLAESEERLRQSALDALAKVEGLERDAREQTKELLKIEESMRTELDDLDRRIVTLADRLLPVIRKTWLRVAELEKAPGAQAVADVEPRLSQLRRELKDEIRKVDLEVADRVRDIRDRMETTIAHQGKVWLTLIHELSALTEERRQAQNVPFPPLAAGPAVDPDPEPEPTSDPELPPEEPEEPPSRRRLRRAGRER